MGLNTGLNIGNYSNGLQAGYQSTTGLSQTPVASNFNTTAFGNTNLGMGNLFPSSAFNGFGSTTDYSNDIMFPQELAMNYNQFASSATGVQPQAQTAQTQFTGGAEDYQNQAQIEAAMAQNPNIRITPNGNLYTVTNTGKKLGVLAGAAIPTVKGLSKAFQGGKFAKSALNLKSLGVKAAAFAIIGWGLGALVDNFFNSNSAKAADAQAQNPQNQGLSYRA